MLSFGSHSLVQTNNASGCTIAISNCIPRANTGSYCNSFHIQKTSWAFDRTFRSIQVLSWHSFSVGQLLCRHHEKVLSTSLPYTLRRNCAPGRAASYHLWDPPSGSSPNLFCRLLVCQPLTAFSTAVVLVSLECSVQPERRAWLLRSAFNTQLQQFRSLQGSMQLHATYM